MGNCLESLKKKDSPELSSILYPLSLERPVVINPEIRNRSDSLKFHSKKEGQTLARIYSYYLDQELSSINDELSQSSIDQPSQTLKRPSIDTLNCGLASCQMRISSNIFKSSESNYCQKHTHCATCGENVCKGEKFVVVSGFIYCKSHIRQYNTL